jgi:hypothetical protein
MRARVFSTSGYRVYEWEDGHVSLESLTEPKTYHYQLDDPMLPIVQMTVKSASPDMDWVEYGDYYEDF